MRSFHRQRAEDCFDAAPGDEIPRWVDELEDRATVNVTLSTRAAEADLLRLIVESVSTLDVNVIVATGACDLPPSLLESPRVHADRYIPHSAVLPRCDLVVCHAGAGIMLKALSFGVPMLLLPRGADQFDNADARVRRELLALPTAETAVEQSEMLLASARQGAAM